MKNADAKSKYSDYDKQTLTQNRAPHPSQPAEINLIQYRRDYFSNNGEDGIIAELLKRMSITSGWCCEVGASDGHTSSNTFNLIKDRKFKGVMIEGDDALYERLLNLSKQFNNITPIKSFIAKDSNSDNFIEKILSKTEIPKDFDVFSLDIDSFDYWVWKNMDVYRPKIVIVETSGLNLDIKWEEGAIHKIHLGGSTAVPPFLELAKEKDYAFVCFSGNLFFVDKKYYHLIKGKT